MDTMLPLKYEFNCNGVDLHIASRYSFTVEKSAAKMNIKRKTLMSEEQKKKLVELIPECVNAKRIVVKTQVVY